MLAAAALALLLLRGDAAAAPRSAVRAAELSRAPEPPLVDLCPPFLAASSAGAAARLAAGGARLPLRKRLHPPRPEDGDVARVMATWRGCEATPAAARAEEAPAEPQLAAPWDSFGGGAGGGAAVLGPAPIEYNGGAILTGDAEAANASPVHLIWYGAWNASDAAVRLLPLAVAGASNSPWMRINAAYWSLPNDTAAAAAAPARRYASPALRLAQQVFVSNYSYGSALGDDDVAAVVADAIDAGLPLSSAAVYVVLTSADVALTSGFCKDYCGWHASGTVAGESIVRFAFVGDPSGCARVSACTPLSAATAPNALGADAMASVLLHELAEAVTDPDLDAWYDRDGLENADKCAWRFGTAATDPQGRLHNVELSGQRFMIQQNWVLPPAPAGGYCAMEPAV